MPLTRRELLKGFGVAAGGMGLAAAGYDRLIPFIHQPDDMVPGVSTWYATSCRECPAGCGAMLRNREGHVVKAEGNPVHPVNSGRLCARGQAALQGLYDPDRIKGPMRRDGGELRSVSWEEATEAVGSVLKRSRGRIALISSLETGSFDALMRQWLSALGSDRLVVYEPIDYQPVKEACGGVVPSFNVGSSDYLISFNADFLETWISPVEYAGQFARMREIRNGRRGRFVYVGPRVSMTAANADERIVVPPGMESAVALAIASELGANVPAGFSVDEIARRLEFDPEQIRRVARGFRAASAPLALPGGDSQSARAAMYLNGVVGSTLVNVNRPHALTNTSARREMISLIEDMENGRIRVLIIYGANPVFSLPESKRFVKALGRLQNVISLSTFSDETSTKCNWVLPSNFSLESWGDYAPYADTTNVLQPTMGKLFDTRQTGDILMDLARGAGLNVPQVFSANNYYECLRRRLGVPVGPNEGPEAVSPDWERLVQIGGRWPNSPEPVTGSISPYGDTPAQITALTGSPAGPIYAPTGAPEGVTPLNPPLVRGEVRGAPSLPLVREEGIAAPSPLAGEGWGEGDSPLLTKEGLGEVEPGQMRLHAFPHIYLYDGRNANRQWLQEMPEPVTKAMWGSWAEIHPQTKKRLGLAYRDLIEIKHGESTVVLPVYVSNGVSPDAIAVPIGQGHAAYGRSASGCGVNVWPLLTEDSPVVTVRKVGGKGTITRRRGGMDQQGREIARTVTLGAAVEPNHVSLPLPEGYKFNDFYPGHEHTPNRWAMVVDMDKCIGCHACVAACYAENNIPVVGPEEIRRGRGMEWLRIDPYVDWKRESAPILFQPMLCQHCDSAPCEPVCPVYAAAHSEDGINMQVYNRCIGTRYCSNNCPYKVRRFNWFDYKWPEPQNWQLNPDVTVRRRGVMEKCTFCVQRVREARVVAKREGRPIRDGEVVPACVETCPTGVFTFGDLQDPNTQVSKLIRENPRAYQVLDTLNTKPAVIYLKRVVERT